MVLSDIEPEKGLAPIERQSSSFTPESTNVVSGTSSFSTPADIRKLVFSYTKRAPSTESMVIEAISAMGQEERGASVKAIAKWICANHAVLDTNKLMVQIKKAVLKSLEGKTIKRSGTSRGALGATGSFVIGKKTASKKLGGKTRLEKSKSTKSKSDQNRT